MPIFRQDTKLLIDKGGLFSTIDISKVRDANSQYGIYTEAQHINREHFKLSVAKVRIIFETTWKNTKSLVFLISINMLGCYFKKKLTKKKRLTITFFFVSFILSALYLHYQVTDLQHIIY